ncbi:unnamed protein product [Ixodes hexagonus]
MNEVKGVCLDFVVEDFEKVSLLSGEPRSGLCKSGATKYGAAMAVRISCKEHNHGQGRNSSLFTTGDRLFQMSTRDRTEQRSIDRVTTLRQRAAFGMVGGIEPDSDVKSGRLIDCRVSSFSVIRDSTTTPSPPTQKGPCARTSALDKMKRGVGDLLWVLLSFLD